MNTHNLQRRWVSIAVIVAMAVGLLGGCGRPNRLAARVPDAAVSGGAVRLVVPAHQTVGPGIVVSVSNPSDQTMYHAYLAAQRSAETVNFAWPPQ